MTLFDDTDVPDSAQNVLLHPQKSLMKGKADAGTSRFTEQSALRPIRSGRERRRLKHRPFTSVSEHIPEQAPEGNCDRDHDVEEGQVKRSSIQKTEAVDTITLTNDLIYACVDGEVEVVEHCVLRLCSKDERALDRFLLRQGKNLLHVVCRNYSHEILRFLLLHSSRPPLNGLDRDNKTPLAVSLRCGSLVCAEILLKNGADPFTSLGDDEEVSRLIPSISGKANAVQKLLLKTRKARRQSNARPITEASFYPQHLISRANDTGPDYSLMSEGLDTHRGLTMQGQSLTYPLRGHSEVQHQDRQATDPTEDACKPSFYMHYTISEDRSQGTVQTILADMGARLERQFTFRTKRAIDDETEICAAQPVSAPTNQASYDMGQIMKQAEHLLLIEDYQACSALCSKAIEVGRQPFTNFKLIAKAFDIQGQADELAKNFSATIAYYQSSLIEHQTLEVLQRLRRLETQDLRGITPLESAAATFRVDVVDFFLQQEANLRKAGLVPVASSYRELQNARARYHAI